MDKNKLRYMEYYGDGDAKAFSASGLIDKGMAVRSNVGNIVGMKKNIYVAWCDVQINVISQMSLKPVYAV